MLAETRPRVYDRAVTSDAPSSDIPSLSSALEATLARLGRMIRSVGARHGLGDPEIDALMQEVRIRLWRAQSDGERISALPTSYVHRTATTAALDLIRQRRRHAEREPELYAGPPAALATTRQADERALASDLGAAIVHVLTGLGEARRVVVRLHLAGYEREEIMALLGWTDAKIRNLLSRGMQDLRDGLRRAGYTWPETR